MFLLVGQETVAFQVSPERDHFEGGLGLTLGEPIITPVILMERLQKPGLVCLDAFATHLLTGATGIALTALLEQLALEPPGPSIDALKVVAALVAQVPVPFQLLAFQFPEAVGEIIGCLVESMIPVPVRFKLHVAVVPCRVAEIWHPGGVSLERVVAQLALPCLPVTVAVKDVSDVWLQVITLLAGVLPSQLTVLLRRLKLSTVPAADVLVSV